MVNAAIQKSTPLNGSLDFWKDCPGKEDNITNSLTTTTLQIPILRVTAKTQLSMGKDPSTLRQVIALVEAARILDSEIVQWGLTVPQAWRFRTVARVEGMPEDLKNAEVYPGDVDEYHDVLIAQFWNTYRCNRLFVHSIILRCIVWLAGSTGKAQETPEYLESVGTLLEMVNGICASVPYTLGYRLSNTEDSKPGGEATVTVLGAYFLLWPVFVAYCLPQTPDTQKTWLVWRLYYIARAFGMRESELETIGDRHVITATPVFEESA